MRKQPERYWHYFIDLEGHLWHEGAEIDDPQILRLFLKGMKQRPDGHYEALCQGEHCLITAEDVPHVVRDLTFSPHQIELVFPGNFSIPLDPSTLFVGRQNVLYCKIMDGKFVARFSRTAYLDIAKRIECDQKQFYLTVDKKRYPIQGVQPT